MQKVVIPENVKEIELKLEKPNQKIQQYYEDYSKGLLSKEVFANKLSLIVLYDHWYFGLKIRKEDIGEFYILLRPIIYRVISQYNNSKSSFATFFYTTIKYAIKSWNRKRVNEHINQSTINNYTLNEKLVSKSYLTCCDSNLYGNTYSENNINLDNFNPNQELYINGKRISKLFLLIITLKLSFYLTDAQITDISNFLGIKKEKLENYVEQCLDSLGPRIRIYKELETSININCIKKNKFNIAQKINSSEYLDPILKSRNDFYSKKWKTSVNRYNTKKMFINQTVIGKVLNISGYKIRYMLRKYELNPNDLREGCFKIIQKKSLENKGIV